MPTAPSPTNLRAAISDSDLRDLYVTQGLTIEQIAARFGLAATTIARRFADLGIRARRRGPLPGTRHGAPLSQGQERQWSAELAYAVGLITTDGCLSQDGRHLTMTSKDFDLLETVRQCLRINARITLSTNPRPCYRLQWGDLIFHRWLMGIGLMPAKSLRLGPLRVPDEWLRDFLRGCIDGDGSIVTYTDRYNTFKKSTYVYTRIYLSLVSASPRFIEWLRSALGRVIGVRGDVSVRRTEGRHDIWKLRYAKQESLILLRWMYHRADVPCLRRKYGIAAPFLVQLTRTRERRRGRPVVT